MVFAGLTYSRRRVCVSDIWDSSGNQTSQAAQSGREVNSLNRARAFSSLAKALKLKLETWLQLSLTPAPSVGAAGFGDRIVPGLAVNDRQTMLAGAVPSDMLALDLQGLLNLVDRRITPVFGL
jgi:hypothetical protein